MNTAAYCAASFLLSVNRAAGCYPLTCPPHTMESLPVGTFQHRDLLYIKLHGLPDQPYWYGDDWITAMSATQVRSLDLSRTIVFCAICHMDDGSPMLDALLSAAATVVAGAGPRWGRPSAVYGVDVLGRAFRRCLQLGFSPAPALRAAKLALRLTAGRDPLAADALTFRLFTPRHPRACPRENGESGDGDTNPPAGAGDPDKPVTTPPLPPGEGPGVRET